MKGIVVDINSREAVILADDGLFKKIKNLNYEIGQTLQINEGSKTSPGVLRGAASMAAVLVIGVIGAFAYLTPTDYVSLDVNPSIEYKVNMFGRILDVNAVNDDGERILSGLELNNKNIEEAVKATLDQLIADGYLADDPDSGVVIATSNDKLVKAEKLAAELEQEVRTYLDSQEGVTAEVAAAAVVPEKVQEAKQLGVTPGKLTLVEKLEASTSGAINRNEWLNMPVKDINKEIKRNWEASGGTPDGTARMTYNSSWNWAQYWTAPKGTGAGNKEYNNWNWNQNQSQQGNWDWNQNQKQQGNWNWNQNQNQQGNWGWNQNQKQQGNWDWNQNQKQQGNWDWSQNQNQNWNWYWTQAPGQKQMIVPAPDQKQTNDKNKNQNQTQKGDSDSSQNRNQSQASDSAVKQNQSQDKEEDQNQDNNQEQKQDNNQDKNQSPNWNWNTSQNQGWTWNRNTNQNQGWTWNRIVAESKEEESDNNGSRDKNQSQSQNKNQNQGKSQNQDKDQTQNQVKNQTQNQDKNQTRNQNQNKNQDQNQPQNRNWNQNQNQTWAVPASTGTGSSSWTDRTNQVYGYNWSSSWYNVKSKSDDNGRSSSDKQSGQDKKSEDDKSNDRKSKNRKSSD